MLRLAGAFGFMEANWHRRRNRTAVRRLALTVEWWPATTGMVLRRVCNRVEDARDCMIATGPVSIPTPGLTGSALFGKRLNAREL